MKTLVIVSHPTILDSTSQQYFLNWTKDRDNITIRHLESEYPNGNIDIKQEQELLKKQDRILFQFPFYWYSSPPLLKHWQDVVLEEGFAYGKRGNALSKKEFGLILMIGVKENEYQAGGAERFSINELTKPYQALAHKTGMTYMKALPIYQFAYMTENEQMHTLIQYQQMLTMENNGSLKTKEQWLAEELEQVKQNLAAADTEMLTHIITHIKENSETIDELKFSLDGM